MDIALVVNHKAGSVNKYAINEALRFFGNISLFETFFNDGNFSVPDLEVNQFKRIGIMGGDGSLSDLVNFLIRNEFQGDVFWIPKGTGNGYARSLYGKTKSLKEHIRNAIEGSPRDVDLIKIVSDFEHYAVNFVDIGFIASVLDKRNRLKLKGILGYIPATLSELFNPQTYNVEMKIDNEIVLQNKSVYDIIAGKGYTPCHFPEVKLLPRGELNDGLLRIAVYDRISFSSGIRALKDGPQRMEFLGKNIKLIIKGKPLIQWDGNMGPFKENAKYKISVAEKYLRIIS